MWQSLQTLFNDTHPARTAQRREAFARPALLLAIVVFAVFAFSQTMLGFNEQSISPFMSVGRFVLVALSPAVIFSPRIANKFGGWLVLAMCVFHLALAWQGVSYNQPYYFVYCLLIYLFFPRKVSAILATVFVVSFGCIVVSKAEDRALDIYIGTLSGVMLVWWLFDAVMIRDRSFAEMLRGGQRTVVIVAAILLLLMFEPMWQRSGFGQYFLQLNLLKMLIIVVCFGVSVYFPRLFVGLLVATTIVVAVLTLLAPTLTERSSMFLFSAMGIWFLYLSAARATMLSLASIVLMFGLHADWILGDGFEFAWRVLAALLTVLSIFWMVTAKLETAEPKVASKSGLAGVFGLSDKVFRQQITRLLADVAVIAGVLFLCIGGLWWLQRSGSVGAGAALTPLLAAPKLLWLWSLMALCMLFVLLWARLQIVRREIQLADAVLDVEKLRYQAEFNSEQARQSNAVKERFINNVSRDMRTPLNSVAGAIALLEQAVDVPKSAREQALQVLGDTSQQLLQMVVNLLDVSKLYNAKEGVQVSESHLRDLLPPLWPALNDLTQRHGVVFMPTTRIPADLVVLVDAGGLAKIINLLVADMASHSHGGLVAMSVNPAEDAAELIITASKYNLPAADVLALQEVLPANKLFKDLVETTSAEQLSFKLCRAYMQMMDGQLVVRSDEHMGTVIKLRLPLASLQSTRSAEGL